jgi:hypothetical protein
MSNRVSRSMVEAAAKRLADALGKQYGDVWKRTEKGNKSIVGAWAMDYNPVYGGYVIVEMCNEHGAERHPLISSRLPAAAMLDALNMAHAAVYMTKATTEAR